jgi:hypothetical protein
MHYTQPAPAILPVHRIIRDPGFQSKLVTKAERSTLEKMLLAVEDVYERSSAKTSPERALRDFTQTFGVFPPGTGPAFVRWARAIRDAAEIEPDFEWELLAEVRCAIEPHLSLIRTVADRVPVMIADAFGEASAQAAAFCELVGIDRDELQARVTATCEHLAYSLKKCEDERDNFGCWVELLRTYGIEV